MYLQGVVVVSVERQGGDAGEEEEAQRRGQVRHQISDEGVQHTHHSLVLAQGAVLRGYEGRKGRFRALCLGTECVGHRAKREEGRGGRVVPRWRANGAV